MTKNNRSSFTGKLGFVLAAAGSAVGLGNLWRFPYLAARHGGGIFLLVYLVLAVTFGFALMIAEIAIGRKTGLSAIGAFQKLNKKYTFVGYLGAIVPAFILPYYSVIGGWVTKYLTVYVTGKGASASADGFFGGFISAPVEPIVWFTLFIGITSLVVIFGVEKGIERVSKVMMPILAVLAVCIAIYSCICSPNNIEGLKYYLIPDFSKFSMSTVLAAMGQLFYSMSLAMGIMITYGSYMKKDVNIESSVGNIEIFDTGIAFMAGLMILPAVGAAGAETAGPGLMFVALPSVFNSMGIAGHIVGAVFFLLVLFAALTSSISLMETVVSILCDNFKLGRKTACLSVFLFSIALGLVTCFGYSLWPDFHPFGNPNNNVLDLFDIVTNNFLMPIGALATCIIVGYLIKPKAIEEEVELSGTFKKKKLFRVVIKYVAPVCLVLILITSVLNAFRTPIENSLIAAYGEKTAQAVLKFFVY